MNRKRTAAWLSCAVVLTGTMASVMADEEADRALLARAQALFKPLPADASTPERPLTPERVALGRALFFETRVSTDGKGSCGGCHNPFFYGTDALPRSVGVHGKVIPRNAPTVFNTALQFVQHYGGNRADVEEQAVKALVSALAYGNADYAAAEARLRALAGLPGDVRARIPRPGRACHRRELGQGDRRVRAHFADASGLRSLPRGGWRRADRAAEARAGQVHQHRLRRLSQRRDRGRADVPEVRRHAGLLDPDRKPGDRSVQRPRQGTLPGHQGRGGRVHLQGPAAAQRRGHPALLPRRLGGRARRRGAHHGQAPARPRPEPGRDRGHRRVSRQPDG